MTNRYKDAEMQRYKVFSTDYADGTTDGHGLARIFCHRGHRELKELFFYRINRINRIDRIGFFSHESHELHEFF